MCVFLLKNAENCGTFQWRVRVLRTHWCCRRRNWHSRSRRVPFWQSSANEGVHRQQCSAWHCTPARCWSYQALGNENALVARSYQKRPMQRECHSRCSSHSHSRNPAPDSCFFAGLPFQVSLLCSKPRSLQSSSDTTRNARALSASSA